MPEDLIHLDGALVGGDSLFGFQLEYNLLFCCWEFLGQQLELEFCVFLCDHDEAVARSAGGCDLTPKGRGRGVGGQC